MPLLGVDMKTRAHLESISSLISPSKPRAVLVVTAHWEADPVRVMAKARPGMFFDYYGFPAESYEYEFLAEGDPGLAATVKSLLSDAKIDCDLDADRDYDHGVFVPGLLAYPKGDVPFVAMSLHASLDADTHLDIGRALSPLRDDGVLILASGMSFHNMRKFNSKTQVAGAVFDKALSEAVMTKTASTRAHALRHWATLPDARDAHPREEHLLPLLVAAGATDDRDTPHRIFHDTLLGAQVSAFHFSSSENNHP